MSHPLTDALPDYLDALALRQACGEIEERVTRERDEARSSQIVALNRLATWRNRAQVAESQCDALRAEVERLRGAEADFHMAYRIKCDEETKAQAVKIERLRAEVERLTSALNAMLTQFGMDEDEWSAPTFKQARAALTPAEVKHDD